MTEPFELPPDFPVELPVERTQLLNNLVEELLRVNQIHNLTAIREPHLAWIKHILDSLQGLRTGLFEGRKTVIDVGAGPGFPSLALAMARPELKMSTLDSTRKKCDFTQATSDKFALDVRVLNGRAEEFGQNKVWRQRFDIGVARAVGSLPEVCELVLPLVKVGGHAVLWRGEQAREEAQSAKNAMRKLGGRLAANAFIEYSLPEHETRYHIVTIEKVGPTPPQYPRRVGIPKQKPLD